MTLLNLEQRNTIAALYLYVIHSKYKDIASVIRKRTSVVG